jgi:hypothetical protein
MHGSHFQHDMLTGLKADLNVFENKDQGIFIKG